MALWALLPLIASQYLGQGADGFGLLFAALGTGAILGALVLGRVKTLSTNRILLAAGILYAGTLTVIVLVPNFVAALATLVLSGVAWMAITSTLQAEMQLVLPGWVRLRHGHLCRDLHGLPDHWCADLGAPRQPVRTPTCHPFGGWRLLAAALAGLIWRLPETGHLDPQPAVYWGDPRVAFDPEPDIGPVLVAVHFTVAADRQPDFLTAMGQLRLSRLRTGATRWELYRDAERPDRFVEIFRVSTWEEHLRQHEGRLTATDQVVEEAALAFSDPPVSTDHLLPP